MGAYVYILGSKSLALYVGVTNNLEARVWQHKNNFKPKSFTARYNINRLLYFEEGDDICAAIAREKRLKKLLRKEKLELIARENPQFYDLAEEWFT